MATFQNLVLVTRKTRLQELVERFGTPGQAEFYITHSGGDFADYRAEDETYREALARLESDFSTLDLRLHVVDRSFVPNYLFSERDVVVTVGQDGLVANVAKYVGAQPIVALNPDPDRFDGVLLPFRVKQARQAVATTLHARATIRDVTLAEAVLSDGQRLLAFNDFFVGVQTHQSARYEIRYAGAAEAHSSSGVIVSTGAGSTGWLSSTFNMAAGVSAFAGGTAGTRMQLSWEDPRLVFVVREPFVSRRSGASIVAGMLDAGQELELESRMTTNGVIFSDGIEHDFLAFNSGTTARIRAASQRARLVVG